VWAAQPPHRIPLVTPGLPRAGRRGGSRPARTPCQHRLRFRGGPTRQQRGAFPCRPRFPGPRRPCSCPLNIGELRGRRQSLMAAATGHNWPWRGSPATPPPDQAARPANRQTSTSRNASTHCSGHHKGPGRRWRVPPGQLAINRAPAQAASRPSSPALQPHRGRSGASLATWPAGQGGPGGGERRDRRVEGRPFLAQLRCGQATITRVRGHPGSPRCARRP